MERKSKELCLLTCTGNTWSSVLKTLPQSQTARPKPTQQVSQTPEQEAII